MVDLWWKDMIHQGKYWDNDITLSYVMDVYVLIVTLKILRMTKLMSKMEEHIFYSFNEYGSNMLKW